MPETPLVFEPVSLPPLLRSWIIGSTNFVFGLHSKRPANYFNSIFKGITRISIAYSDKSGPYISVYSGPIQDTSYSYSECPETLSNINLDE